MNGIESLALTGGRVHVDAAAISALGSAIDGRLIGPQDAEYDEVRAIWNGMIDRHPSLVIECATADDVARAVRFAREHDLLATFRGGGHNIAGTSIADYALLVDMSTMNRVDVDPDERTAVVQPGATLGDVDAATAEHGLAVPVGINSTTGIAGLTVGGGFGWLTRQHGLTCDNLLSAEVVTADGEMLTASASENEDLFWALRGGGGNFGIATSFRFSLVDCGPEVIAGLVVYPREQGREVLRQYRELCATAPEELSVWVVMRNAPPLPFLPEESHGTEVVVLAMVYNGDLDEGMRIVEPYMQLGTPVGTHVGPAPFAGFQQAFDPLLTPGARNYWKTHDFGALNDGLIEVLLTAAGRLPSNECEVFVAHLGGAMSRVPVADTAYAGRDAEFVMNVHARWQEADLDEACIGWSRELFGAAEPHALGTAYVNFMTEDESARVESAYGANFERLRTIKQRCDPDNFFRRNQNVAAAD